MINPPNVSRMTDRAAVEETASYGNWMPKKFIIIGVVLSAASGSLAGIILLPWLQVLLWIFSAFCGVLACDAMYAYHQFSSRGGNVQSTIHDLVVKLLPWDGHGMCLDIGCGSAPVSIKIAKRYPAARVIGGDCWGETYFEYTEQQCVKNALAEGVADRVVFQHANAARLPYDDGSFDAIVSNLTFHEMSALGRGERYKAILEALRVLKKGGAFAVQDVFKLRAAFGDFEQMRRILARHVTEIHWVDSFTALQLPRALDSPLFLKGLGTFYGRK